MRPCNVRFAAMRRDRTGSFSSLSFLQSSVTPAITEICVSLLFLAAGSGAALRAAAPRGGGH